MRAKATVGLVLMGLSAATAFSRSAGACSLVGPNAWVADASVDDGTAPPSAPSLVEVAVTRGKGPQRSGCGEQMVSSCDDLGMINVRLTPSVDDRTPTERIGYQAFLVGGSLPGGGKLSSEAFLLGRDGTWFFHWLDESTDSQEVIDFTIVLIALDAAGNESAPSAEIRIQHGGSDPGCAVRRQGQSPFGWLLPALAVALLGRRALGRPAAAR